MSGRTVATLRVDGTRATGVGVGGRAGALGLPGVAGRGVGRVGQLKITERSFRRLPSFLPGFMT